MKAKITVIVSNKSYNHGISLKEMIIGFFNKFVSIEFKKNILSINSELDYEENYCLDIKINVELAKQTYLFCKNNKQDLKKLFTKENLFLIGIDFNFSDYFKI